MLIHCVHVVLPVSRDEAFAFLSRLENLPAWATEFIRGDFRMDGEVARARTAHGDVTLRIRAVQDTGVIDVQAAIAGETDVVFPSRVLPLPDGRSVYVFTAIQGPDQSPDAFEADLAALKRELGALPQLLERSHASAH